MYPIDIKAFSDPDAFNKPNSAPQVDDFLDQVTLEAGSGAVTVSVGKPYDVQGDAFFVKSWELKDGANFAWVRFNNATAQSSLDFSFDPPAKAAGVTFTIKIVLIDTNKNLSLIHI